MGQVQSVTHDSSVQTGARHLALLEYQYRRGAGAGAGVAEAAAATPQMDATYFGNAYNLAGEDGCYIFSYDKKGQQLVMGLMEVKDASVSKADFRKEVLLLFHKP